MGFGLDLGHRPPSLDRDPAGPGRFEAKERLRRPRGLADVGNLRVTEPSRRRGVAPWRLGQAADWLRLADVDRLLDHAWLEGADPGELEAADYRAFLRADGFGELTRAKRGWTRTLQQA